MNYQKKVGEHIADRFRCVKCIGRDFLLLRWSMVVVHHYHFIVFRLLRLHSDRLVQR
jgi:hypothetical protein